MASLLRALEHRLHGAQQRQLLHPAARERVHRQHQQSGAQRVQMALPARHVLGLQCGGARRPHLVEQHQHRLVEPREQLDLGLDVERGLGRLGRVDEVQHRVGVFAHVAQRLLRVPERAVAPAVPHLGKKPSERVALQAQPAHQAHAVAEARGVPQAQLVAGAAAHQQMVFAQFGDVRLIAHFTDVTLQQRARQRGLAHVGVRDQAQCD
jgi:hypothetical protein